jgi:hypothetical protein
MKCTGCYPRVIDRATNRALPDDHPVVAASLHIWKLAPDFVREAYHRVYCLDSKDPEDRKRFQELQVLMKAAGGAADEALRASQGRKQN